MLDHSITFTMRVFHAQRLKKSTCPLFLCVVLLLTLEEVVNKANALQMITQPNKTIVSFIGSNQTFSWNFVLTEEEKAKEFKVTFGHWSKEYSMVLGDHLVTFVQDPIGKERVYKGNASIARRLNWVGDMARGFVAFQLTDVQAHDSSDFGIRFRVDGFPPETEESGFTLSTQDPPSIPTRTPEPQDITINIVEGDVLNITCRTLMSGSSSVSWLKDNKLIENEDEKTLFIGNVNRSQSGKYICVSLSLYGNHSSPVTTVNVLYPPEIYTGDEQVLVELLRGHSMPLKCGAAGNPLPVLSWHRLRDGISQTFKNLWYSSSLVVTPINDTDFTSYTCIATNKLGSDQVTFILKEKELPTNASQGEMVIEDAANLEIACHSDFIDVTVEGKNYPGLDTNVTHLEDEACVPVYKDDSKAVFRFGLEECKTKHEDDGKMVSYSNRIIAVVRDVVDEADITRKSTRILPFKCSYQKKTLLSKVSYSPRYVQVVTDAENYGNFTYLMNMYTDKENSKKVEKFPLLVGISQRLYISLKVQSGDSDLSLFPDECKATPSTEYNAKPDHKMIEQGCPRDRYLEYEYEKSAYQNFSFVAFRFKRGYDDVYIHCKLTVCRSDDEKSKCDSGCQEEGNQSRRKRNIHDEYRTELYVGPIKMTGEQDKAMKSGETPTIIKDKSKTVLLVGVLAGVLGTISLGLVGALIIVTRRGRHSETGATLLVQDD